LKIQRAQRLNATIPLCSTADIAFLLLIFFIVLSKNANESSLEWLPAESPQLLVDADNSVVTVIIDKKYDVFVNGHEVAPSMVKSVVQSYLGDRAPGLRKVLLKIDKDVPERVFGKVLLDIGEAGGDIFRALDTVSEKK